MRTPMHTRLTRAVLDVERYTAETGWDQPPRLFALVETLDLLRREPHLAVTLDLAEDALPGDLTPVEQDELPSDQSLDDVLARITWPDEVSGCTLVVERLMLPPEAEENMPDDPAVIDAWVAQHPDRQEVRLAVGVLRDGTRDAAVRMRTHDHEDDVLSGEDLVPRLAEALAATFEPE
ncbi:MAG: PPA1309 family protein [Actinomycetes bacterium]